MNGAGLVEIDAGRLDVADLEEQRLLLHQRAVAGEGRVRRRCRRRRGVGGAALTVQHHSTSFRRGDEGGAVLVGVHLGGGDDEQIVEPGARQEPRDRHAAEHALARPAPRRPRAAGFGSCSVNSLKKVVVERPRRPAPAASASASFTALAWLIRASRRRPASPSSVMWMVKASTQRPELVQMFDVAFSRRMCCSRVDSVSTKPRRPSASTVSPQSRPGIWRTNFCARGEEADIGAAEDQRVADRLALADDDVGAHRAGRRRRGRATRPR